MIVVVSLLLGASCRLLLARCCFQMQEELELNGLSEFILYTRLT